MTQHASLAPERWGTFPKDQQLLMIANEMNRATRFERVEDMASLRRSYERILRLVDLTVEVNTERSLRRELLRWRDLVADLYLAPQPDPERLRAVFRALLLLSPATYRQIPFVLGSR